MLLRLGHDLHYPITVTKLLKSAGDQVETNQPLFWYSYYGEVEESDEYQNRVRVQRKFFSAYESFTDGEVVDWKVSKGDVLEGPWVFLFCHLLGFKLTCLAALMSLRSKSHAPMKFSLEGCVETVGKI